jgi:peptidoglycan/LPS O-acetylase OafA/YrhL
VIVPSLGSNGPLWSLSNEFWYYILFPCLCLLLLGNSTWRRVACCGVILLVSTVGLGLMALFPVWLLGAVLGLVPRWGPLSFPGIKQAAFALSAGCFAAALTLARVNWFQNSLASDYCVGVAFALLMYVILSQKSRRAAKWYGYCASGLANMSYTLYLTHLPVLVFLYAVLGLDSRWQPDPSHLSVLAVLCAGTFMYSLVLSQLTEARTDKIRRIVRGTLSLSPAKQFEVENVGS